MPHRATHVLVGTAGCFTLGGLLEALRSPSTQSWLMFAGSICSTVAAIWVAERKRADRLQGDRASLEMQVRILRLMDLQEARATAAAAVVPRTTPAPAPDLTRPQSEGS